MPNVTTAKHLTRFNKPIHSILNHIPPGKRVRLREDVYKRVKQREWILDKIDSEGVHLLHESKAYGLIVRAEDIDWSELEGEFVERNQPALSERRGFEN
jgi:hypothetical protein